MGNSFGFGVYKESYIKRGPANPGVGAGLIYLRQILFMNTVVEISKVTGGARKYTNSVV